MMSKSRHLSILFSPVLCPQRYLNLKIVGRFTGSWSQKSLRVLRVSKTQIFHLGPPTQNESVDLADELS